MTHIRFALLKAELEAHPKRGILFPVIDLAEASDEALEALDACEQIGGPNGLPHRHRSTSGGGCGWRLI